MVKQNDFLQQILLHKYSFSKIICSPHSHLVVGTETKVKLMVKVYNHGQPAFIPKLKIQVKRPYDLHLPPKADCYRSLNSTWIWLLCNLDNPIKKEKEVIIR